MSKFDPLSPNVIVHVFRLEMTYATQYSVEIAMSSINDL